MNMTLLRAMGRELLNIMTWGELLALLALCVAAAVLF